MNPWTVRIDYGRAELALRLPQHPDEHRPERPILLAVDQQLGEGAALRATRELADPVGSLEVGRHEDVEQLGAGSDPNASRRATEPASISSKVTWRTVVPQSHVTPVIVQLRIGSPFSTLSWM